MMQRMFLTVLLCVPFCGVVFGQQPGDVMLEPIVDFSGVFDGLKDWITDPLKEGWVLIISISFVFAIYIWVEAIIACMRRMRIHKQERLAEVHQDIRQLERQRALEREYQCSGIEGE
jgi:hypothetical protein